MEESVYNEGNDSFAVGEPTPLSEPILDAEVYGMIGEPERKFWMRKPKQKTISMDNPIYDTQMMIQQNPEFTESDADQVSNHNDLSVPTVTITCLDDEDENEYKREIKHEREIKQEPLYENTSELYSPAEAADESASSDEYHSFSSDEGRFFTESVLMQAQCLALFFNQFCISNPFVKNNCSIIQL